MLCWDVVPTPWLRAGACGFSIGRCDRHGGKGSVVIERNEYLCANGDGRRRGCDTPTGELESRGVFT